MPACFHCSKAMAASAAVCPHCARSAKPEVRGHHQTVTCPKCQSRCDVVLFGDVHLDICRACRGLWFDRDELRDFGNALANADLNARVQDVLRELGTRSSGTPDSAYPPCPICRSPMLRTAYARVSGIFVDTCSRHGTWADHDEALRLIELFKDGGDDRLRDIAEQRARDDLNRSVQRVQAAQAAHAAQIRTLDIRSRVHLFLDWFDFL